MKPLSWIYTLLSGRVPGQLVVQITDLCNATCPQCGMRVHNPFERSSIPEPDLEKLIDHAASLNFSAISFTGGEPFLNKDLLIRLIKRAQDAGIPFIRTGTNGFLFRHWARPGFEDRVKALAEELAATSLRNFWISIDSCEPDIHERMRGLPGVIKGIEKALPIFHNAGLYPSANLGINRNIGGNVTFSLKPSYFFSYDDYLNAFSTAYTQAFHRFYRFVINLGFTMVNTCYPMSLPENLNGKGLQAIYAASADDFVVRYSRDEKHRLFKALKTVIPHYRPMLRIFSPLSALHGLERQYGNEKIPSFKMPYPCRGGLDFFYVRTPDAHTFPCGFRGNEDLGAFHLFSPTTHSHQKAFCRECDWECFRDPSDLTGPFLDFLHPVRLVKKMVLDPEFRHIWLTDMSYYRACGFFNGKIPPDTKRMARFFPKEPESILGNRTVAEL